MYIALEVLRPQFIVDNSTPTICCSFIHECARFICMLSCVCGVEKGWFMIFCCVLHFIYKEILSILTHLLLLLIDLQAHIPAHYWIFSDFASNFKIEILSSKNLKYVPQKSLCASTCNMIQDSKYHICDYFAIHQNYISNCEFDRMKVKREDLISDEICCFLNMSCRGVIEIYNCYIKYFFITD